MSSRTMEIIITGPQGCGKTVAASIISALLKALGADPFFFDENQPANFPDPLTLVELKKLFGGQEIIIQATNRTIDLEEDFSRLSVENALELLLVHGESAQGKRRDYDSDAVPQNVPEEKKHRSAGKNNCSVARPEGLRADNNES